MFKKVKRYLRDPYYALGFNLMESHPNWMSDKYYLSVLWKMKMGYELDWKHPKTFNEKLQWLKLYDRKPEYTLLVDKYRVKQWVADRIGEQYVIPTLAVYNSVEEIDLGKLPNRFVLKCNHDSGSVVVCRDKSDLNLDAAKQKLGSALKKNFYNVAREWPYKRVEPCVFAEQFIQDEGGGLVDYKFFCFGGEPDCVMVCLDRHLSQPKFYFFDKDWRLKRLNYRGKTAATDFSLPRPGNLDEMFDLAAVLSKGIPFVRVDFYDVNGHVKFGEMTFFPEGGFDNHILPEADLYFGNKLAIDNL